MLRTASHCVQFQPKQTVLHLDASNICCTPACQTHCKSATLCAPLWPPQGKRVLVHGGAGGVGGFAIQVRTAVLLLTLSTTTPCLGRPTRPAMPAVLRLPLDPAAPSCPVSQLPLQIAKAHGAHVTATCSTRNVEFVTRELGADEAVDYTTVSHPAAWVLSPTLAWHLHCPPAILMCRAVIFVLLESQNAPACRQRFVVQPSTLNTSHPHASAHHTQGPWDAGLAAAGQRYDAVVDTIGGSYQAASMRLLAPGGCFSALGATGPGLEHVSVLGMIGLMAGAAWRTLLGKLRLGPKFKL